MHLEKVPKRGLMVGCAGVNRASCTKVEVEEDVESSGRGNAKGCGIEDVSGKEFCFKSKVELQLEWLQQEVGFTDAQIKRLASTVLSNQVWRNVLLLSKLKSMGMSDVQLRKTILRNPKLLGLSAQKLDAYFSLLREYDIVNKNALQVLVSAPQNVNLSIARNWRPKLDALHKIGLSKPEVRLVIKSFPPLIGCRFHDNIWKKMQWFTREVDIDIATCVHKVFVRAPMVFACNSSSLSESVKMLKDWGMPLSGISQVIMTYPTILSMRPDTLKAKFAFATKFLQKTPDVIVRSPRYFGSSLENVIMFRVAILDMNGIDYTELRLNVLVTMSSAQFHRKFGMLEDLTFKNWWKTLDYAQKIRAIDSKKYEGRL